MTLQGAEQQLYIPFNELGYEVIPEARYLGKTNVQTRFDTRKSQAKLLPLRVNRQIYATLENERDKIDSFYSETHKRMGISKDTVNDRVQKLWEDMNRYGLWADEILVVQDPKELIFNSELEYGKLPAILQGTSVEVRGPESLKIADSKHGMTIDEFIEAGGKFFGGEVLAYLDQHPSLKETHYVEQNLKILGLRKGDKYSTNLDLKHSYAIKPFGAVLCPSGEGSDVDSGYWLGDGVDGWGVVVGRKLSSANENFYKNKLSDLQVQVRNIEKEIKTALNE